MTAVLLAATPALAGGGRPVPLAEVLEQVAEGSHAARAADLDLRRAEARLEERHTVFLPRVEIEGGYTVRDSPMVAVFDGFAAPFGTSTFWQYRVGAEELLWDGGRRRNAVAAAGAAVRATKEGGAAQVRRAQVEALEAYLGAVLGHRRRWVVQRRLEAIRGHLADAENLYAQGMVARNDLLETRVRLRSVEDALPRVEDAIEVAGRRLARLMGLPGDAVVAVPDDLGPPPPLAADLETLAKEAVAANPRLEALAAQIEAARRREAAEAAGAMPQVLVQAAHTYEENPYLEYNHVNLALLGLRWELFDGGARRARVTAVRLEAQRLERDLDEARRELTERLDEALRALVQARREEATARDNVAAAEENLRIVSDQYRAGLARSSDVLDAEALLAESRLDLARRRLEIYGREGEVLALAGRDLAAFFGGRAAEEEANHGR